MRVKAIRGKWVPRVLIIPQWLVHHALKILKNAFDRHASAELQFHAALGAEETKTGQGVASTFMAVKVTKGTEVWALACQVSPWANCSRTAVVSPTS